MEMQYLILILAALASAIITIFTGFGVGTIMLPIMALFFDIKVAVFLTAIIHFFNNLSRIFLYYSKIDWKVIRRFGLISLVGAFIGSYAQFYIESAWLKTGVGLFLVLYTAFSLMPNNINIKFPSQIDFLGGFLSGFVGGLIGNQGAIRSLYLLNYDLKKQTLIVSAAFIAIIIDATRIPIYAYTHLHYLEENLFLMSLIILTSIFGTFIGGKLLPKVSNEAFKKIILLGVFLIGLLMMIGII